MKRFILSAVCLGAALTAGLPGVYGQEFLFNDPLQVPLLTNPALTGNIGTADAGEKSLYRAGSAYQINDVSLSNPPQAAYVGPDRYVPKLRSGFGLYYAGSWTPGFERLSQLGLSYSYRIVDGEDLRVQAGVTGTVSQLSIDFSGLGSGSSVNPNTGFISNDTSSLSVIGMWNGDPYLNVNAGLFASYKQFFGGISVQDVVTKERPVLGNAEHIVQPTLNVQGGYRGQLSGNWRWQTDVLYQFGQYYTTYQGHLRASRERFTAGIGYRYRIDDYAEALHESYENTLLLTAGVLVFEDTYLGINYAASHDEARSALSSSWLFSLRTSFNGSGSAGADRPTAPDFW